MGRRNRQHIVQSDDHICSGCGAPCRVKIIDEGIGPYEFWGQKGNHSLPTPASVCCGEDVLDISTGLPIGISGLDFEPDEP